VSRTFHFGRVGVSNSEFGSFLEGIRLSDHFVKFSDLDLSYLSLRRWDKEYLAAVARSKLVSLQDLVGLMREGDEAAAGLGVATGPLGDGLRVHYASFQEFERIAAVLRIMDNIKANVPRTAYHGIVSTWIGGSRLRAHVVPSPAFAAKLSV
jgi:alpha-1,3-mannosyl-glycoprotein beta-1,2-N-acetylglucosaminyltransferase